MNIRTIIVLTMGLVLFVVAQAQDDSSIRQPLMQASVDKPAAAEKDESTTESSEPDGEDEAESSATDEPDDEDEATESGSYEEEDGFIPSEDVSSDQSLRFPVDI